LVAHCGVGEKSVIFYRDGSHRARAAGGLNRTDIPNEPTSMDMISFMFNGLPIRVKLIHNEPWWVAKDVAEALGYVWNGMKNVSHIPEEWRGVESVSTPSGVQQMHLLSEPGLNIFMVRSDKPAALPFQKWIAGDVLPSIRKAGNYEAIPRLPQTYLAALKALTKEVEKQEALAGRMAEAEQSFNSPHAHVVRGLSVHEVAQLLFKGLGVAANTARNSMYRWLRGKGYLVPGTCVPFQQWFDEGFFWVIAQTATGAPTATGKPTNHLSSVALITGKGFDRFKLEFKAEDVPTKEEDQNQMSAYSRRTNS
jgi:prophage antirepressor-like protein